MDMATDPNPKLPDDVVTEILTRVPVKSLLKFRCVCKSWLSLFSSQQFIKTHLEFSKKDPNYTCHGIILNCRGSLKPCSSRSLLRDPIVDASDTDFSPQVSRNSIWAVGSCDGLICVALDKKDLFLWNPSTRISRKLPDFGVQMSLRSHFAYGLGFDKSSDDYKVVGFFKSGRNFSEVIGKVYSLKADRWKTIKSFKGRWLMDDPAMFANGKLYWITDSDWELHYGTGWDIGFLDLATEEYGLLKVPSYVQCGFYSRLGTCEGRLFVMCSHISSADVWIMDDCGIENETWTHVVNVPYVDDFLRYHYKRVLYLVKNGEEVVLICGSKLVIFDAKDCSFRYPEIRNVGEPITAGTYYESLVSPFGRW